MQGGRHPAMYNLTQNKTSALPQHGKAVLMTKYTVINDFRQISFRSYKKALNYCAENNISQNNIFVDER